MEPRMQNIALAVADQAQLSVQDLRGPVRKRSVARPRQIAMFITREMTGQSLPNIGRFYHRDHTTVIHAMRCIGDLMQRDPEIASLVQAALTDLWAKSTTFRSTRDVQRILSHAEPFKTVNDDG